MECLEGIIETAKELAANPYVLFFGTKAANIAWNYYHGLKSAKEVKGRRKKTEKIFKKYMFDYGLPWFTSLSEGVVLSFAGNYADIGCMTSFPLAVAARQYAQYVKLKKNNIG